MSPRSIIPLCLTALALAHCGPPGDSTIDIVFDPCVPLTIAPAADASASERTSIDDAIAMWNHNANTQLQTPGAEPTQESIPVLFETAALAFYGLYRDELGDVVINRALQDRRERAITIAHELGHAFGLPHVDADRRASVMNQANLALEPNSRDVLALEQLWGVCDGR